ncbi:MAG: hypothetical protein BGN82_04435 [Alphaproteobacteria bacterium 65-7]|nr:MAG: hypothetical protein BGN82_04435 [Alphaproteobacteria bacterium 65-7]
MRFFRKDDDAPRWVDTDALRWNPEEPLEAEPRFAPGNDVGWTQDWRSEPRAAVPDLAPPETPAPPSVPVTLLADAPEIAPANLNRAPRLGPARLAIGVAQGLFVWGLLAAREAGVWPGSDPYFFSALMLAGLFAPLVLLEGLGEIETRLLMLWSGTVAAVTATLGLYHHWRIQGLEQPSYSLFTVSVLCALMLFTAQVMIRAMLREGRALPPYRALFDATWALAARLLVWAVVAGFAWALIGSGNSLLNWLRQTNPALDLGVAPLLLILPLIGLASAAALQLTAPDCRIGHTLLRRALTTTLVTFFTVALPMLVLASASLLAVHLTATPLPLAWSLGLALLLVLAINASFRGEEPRASWRKASEFLAAFLLVALVAVAALALQTRVAAFGWTGLRVLAAAAILMLGGYGVSYAAAALISIGGGRWMQRVEGSNRLLGLLLVGACLALASPLADPVRLAVQTQVARAGQGENLDFPWLRNKGLRFGQDALLAMTRSDNPLLARDAAITLSVAPAADTPTPSEIGANIILRTPGARLPNSLLEPDWSAFAGQVPPCLTRPTATCEAWFLDLDHDGRNEILLVYGNDARWWAAVMKQGPDGWRPAASLAAPPCRGSLDAMRAGDIRPAEPLPGWRDLLVAGMRLTPTPVPGSYQPCLKPF